MTSQAQNTETPQKTTNTGLDAAFEVCIRIPELAEEASAFMWASSSDVKYHKEEILNLLLTGLRNTAIGFDIIALEKGIASLLETCSK